jgi:peptidoglycan/xylan/chitin deacetylase (PgdA/CDA1 family)
MRAYGRGRQLRARLRRGDSGWTGVRILGYHRIDDERCDLSVRPTAFRDQMLRLLDAGLTPVRLDRAIDLLRAPIDGRYVCVTFDDGYRDNLEHAVPVLTELGIPATIYVPTAIIDGRAPYWWFDRQPPALDWDEIVQLVAGGLVDVQAHTRTHPLLPHVADIAVARDEIAGSKADIERRLPGRVTSFAYPAGLYGERERVLVAEAGFAAAVTTEPGVNRGGSDLHELRRTLVYWDDEPADFAAKLAGHLDRPPILRRWLYGRLARA